MVNRDLYQTSSYCVNTKMIYLKTVIISFPNSFCNCISNKQSRRNYMVPDKECSKLKMSDAIDWLKPPKCPGSHQEFSACRRNTHFFATFKLIIPKPWRRNSLFCLSNEISTLIIRETIPSSYMEMDLEIPCICRPPHCSVN